MNTLLNIFEKSSFTKMHNENSIVVLGDCLEVLKSIKTSSVDLVFADPPYGIGKDFGNDSDFFKDKKEYFKWAKKWMNV